MWRSAVQLCLGLRTAQTRIVPCLPIDIGGLAQLARAPALQAGGQRFESVILHFSLPLLWDSGTAFNDILHKKKRSNKSNQDQRR